MQVGLIMNKPDTPIGNLFLVLASIVGKENQVIHLQNVLTLLFEPRSAREEFLVEELALARQELAELGQRREALLAAQRETAARHYDQEAYDRFMRWKRQWRKYPSVVQPLMANEHLGAQSMAETWLVMARQLEDDTAAPGLDVACDALLAEGLPDAVAFQSSESWWLMGRLLAIHPDPERLIKGWVHRSRSYDNITDTKRALTALADAPSTGEARQNLLAHARQRAEFWQNRARELHARHTANRELFSQAFQADRTLTTSLKTLETQRNSVFRMVEKLEKRLESLQRARLKDEARQMRQARQAASPKQARSESTMTQPGPLEPERDHDQKPVEEVATTPDSPGFYTTFSAPAAASAVVPSGQVEPERPRASCQPQPSSVRRTLRLQEVEKMLATWPDDDVTNDAQLTRFHTTFQKVPKHQKRIIMQMLAAEQARRLARPGLVGVG